MSVYMLELCNPTFSLTKKAYFKIKNYIILS